MTTRRATILEDGRVLVGRQWIKPQDYQTSEVADGALPSLKGCTPPELPGFNDQAREVYPHDNV